MNYRYHGKYDEKELVSWKTTVIVKQMQLNRMTSKYDVCYGICSSTILNMKTWNHICTVFLVIPNVLVLLVKFVAYRYLFCNNLTAEPVMILISYLITIFLMLVKIIVYVTVFLWFSICSCLRKHFSASVLVILLSSKMLKTQANRNLQQISVLFH